MEEIRSKINIMMCELNEMKDNLLFVMGELNDLKKEQETEDTANNNWIPNEMEKYYFIDSLDLMCIDCCHWHDDDIDKARLNHKVIFKTEAEAVEYLEYLEEKEKYMNTFTEEEWKNVHVIKYYYTYDCLDKIFIIFNTGTCKENKLYFKTEEEAEDFAQKYEWQIKHELGVK